MAEKYQMQPLEMILKHGWMCKDSDLIFIRKAQVLFRKGANLHKLGLDKSSVFVGARKVLLVIDTAIVLAQWLIILNSNPDT